MISKIKVIIADDNKYLSEIIKKYLENYEEIEVLGIANTDEEEIKLIEELKPEIVITDLMRNGRYTGLDIIKDYSSSNSLPRFLVISSDIKEYIIGDDIKIAGYIKKPILDYDIIFNELIRIKNEISSP